MLPSYFGKWGLPRYVVNPPKVTLLKKTDTFSPSSYPVSTAPQPAWDLVLPSRVGFFFFLRNLQKEYSATKR